MTKDFQWDWLVKIIHWSVAILFISNYALNEPGDDPHVLIGYTIIGLVALRLVWGLITSSPARLTKIKPSPKAAIEHLKEVLETQKDDHVGHNPAGSVMVWCMWLGLLATGISGWMMETDTFWGEEWVEELHELAANATFLCVCIHIAAIVIMTRLTGRRYVQTMTFVKK